MSNRTYHDAHNAPASNSQVSIDRARGGTIHLRITIPEERLPVRGGIGSVVIPKKELNLLVDLEELPLVNVASYKIDRNQTGPAKMSYPYGGAVDDGAENVFAGSFERA